MATFPASFRNHSAAIHGEHQQLLARLAELAAALEAMGPSTVSVDPSGAGRVRRCVAALQELLPAHFQHEETALLAAVAPVSPELAEFARQMRQQHRHFVTRLNDFMTAVVAVESGDGGGRSLLSLKEEGELLAHDIAAHIALEEQQLDGFL